jgi:hypothetical protein
MMFFAETGGYFMADSETFPALVCRCGNPIPLPPATHPDISQGLGSWPTDGALRNFACPACRSVYEYSAKDVHPFPIEKLPESKPRSVVVILLPCGVVGCASLLRIHTLMGNDADLRQAAPEVVARSLAHAIRCDIGHTLTGLPKMGGPIRAQFDDDWESLKQ